MNQQLLLKWIKLILVIYAIIGIALYLLQDLLLFHPVVVQKDSTYHFSQPYKELFIPIEEETNRRKKRGYEQ